MNENYQELGRKFILLSEMVGNGEVDKGICLIEDMARIIQHARYKNAKANGDKEAIERIRHACDWLEKNSEKSVDINFQKYGAMRLISETARFWLEEYNHD